ncbi:NERD domain-containing protein [Thiobacillus denitrificans]|uniref:NERD domain-containing protein n=1 Tax=Thiobacillus denitrificans TaxID=36861 RepID=UPI00036F3C9C|nr:NERD domain-containing protein [Thiobacillus denitrificans]
MHLIEEIFVAMSHLLNRLMKFSVDVTRALMGGRQETFLVRAAFGCLLVGIFLVVGGIQSHWAVLVAAAVPGVLFMVLLSAAYAGAKSFFTVTGMGVVALFAILWLFNMDNAQYLVLATGMLFVTGMIAFLDGAMVSSMIRGALADMRVKSTLKRIAGKTGHVIHNVLLQSELYSCEIDHILINHAGVFVVETKGMSGRIFNQGENMPWIQAPSTDHSMEFESPIEQNARHVSVLKELLGTEYPIYSLVVFTNATFANAMPSNVIQVGDLKKYIRQFKHKAIVSSAQAHALNTIESKRDTSRAGQREHRRRVEERRLREHMAG